MAKVFISYAHEDRELARQLFDGLSSMGHDVWWDQRLQGGEDFRQRIIDELDRVEAIFVVWTKVSIAKRWVHEEAIVGLARKMLIPVRFEAGVQPPEPFNKLHMGSLIDWDGNPKAAELLVLNARITQIQAGRFTDAFAALGGSSLQKAVKGNEAVRAIVTIGSSVAGLPAHRYIRGVAVCAVVLGVFQLAADAVSNESSNFLAVTVLSALLIALGRFCGQIVARAKTGVSLHFFDSSFSYWSCVFLCAGLVVFALLVHWQATVSLSMLLAILTAVGGMALMYVVRSLMLGFNAMIKRI